MSDLNKQIEEIFDGTIDGDGYLLNWGTSPPRVIAYPEDLEELKKLIKSGGLKIDEEKLKGEIWSLSLKYLDYMNHCAKEGEEYYLYRDDKARELSEEVVKKLLELTGGKDE